MCTNHTDCKIGIFVEYFWIRQVVIRAGVYCPHSWAQLVVFCYHIFTPHQNWYYWLPSQYGDGVNVSYFISSLPTRTGTTDSPHNMGMEWMYHTLYLHSPPELVLLTPLTIWGWSECIIFYIFTPHQNWYYWLPSQYGDGVNVSYFISSLPTRTGTTDSPHNLGMEWMYHTIYLHSLTCRNYLCQHSTITETTIEQLPLAFILFDFQHWDNPASFHWCYFWCRKHLHYTLGIPSLFHILASFVHICSPTGRVMDCEVV